MVVLVFIGIADCERVPNTIIVGQFYCEITGGSLYNNTRHSIDISDIKGIKSLPVFISFRSLGFSTWVDIEVSLPGTVLISRWKSGGETFTPIEVKIPKEKSVSTSFEAPFKSDTKAGASYKPDKACRSIRISLGPYQVSEFKCESSPNCDW